MKSRNKIKRKRKGRKQRQRRKSKRKKGKEAEPKKNIIKSPINGNVNLKGRMRAGAE